MIYNLSDDSFINWDCLTGRRPVKLRQYDNRLWAVTDDGALCFSNNGDATKGDTNNIIRLPNQEPIVDFIPVQGGAVIYSRISIYGFYGSGTFQDTSIPLIKDGLLLTDGAVQVDNTVFILGNNGICAVALNGYQEIPLPQNAYFKANYPVWSARANGVVQGVYLYRFHAILYLFNQSYGTQGFLFYLPTKGVYKVNKSLPPALPCLASLFDGTVDFLIPRTVLRVIFGGGIGRHVMATDICRSTYPTQTTASRTATFQTRFEDFDSQRDKVFGELKIKSSAITGSTITAYVDGGDGVVVSDADLIDGENRIFLDRFKLRGKTISFKVDITGTQAFTIKELATRYYETGPEV